MKPVDHRDAVHLGAMVGPNGILTTCTYAKKTHRAPTPPAPPGHHFDGTGIRTVEEHAAADIAARPTTPPPTTRQGG